MKERKFKVGDKVRIIKYLADFKNGRFDIGTVGTIKDIALHPGSYVVYVEDSFGWFNEEELELVEDIKIVVKDDLRPCTVGDRNGKFHKWIEEQKIIIKSNTMHKPEYLEHIKQFIDRCSIMPNTCEYNIITKTVALVEFEDGSVKKVDPEEVRFVV